MSGLLYHYSRLHGGVIYLNPGKTFDPIPGQFVKNPEMRQAAIENAVLSTSGLAIHELLRADHSVASEADHLVASEADHSVASEAGLDFFQGLSINHKIRMVETMEMLSLWMRHQGMVRNGEGISDGRRIAEIYTTLGPVPRSPDDINTCFWNSLLVENTVKYAPNDSLLFLLSPSGLINGFVDVYTFRFIGQGLDSRKCLRIKDNGEQCRSFPMTGKTFCYNHSPR
jgi:hypothetical protein